MKKIVVLDGYALNPGDLSWKNLEKLGNVKIYDRTLPEEILPRLGDAEVAITNKTVFTPEIISAAKNLEYIGVLATGYNVVDIEAAKAKGIVVTNVPAYSTPSVVQHVFALLLALTNNAAKYSKAVSESKWEKSIDFTFYLDPIVELAGKTFGIIGFGAIGSAVANVARALGMNVIAFSRTPKDVDGVSFVSLNELFSTSDVISLHCPLNEKTAGIINKDNIEKMKTSAYLINTGRGPLVVEEDLAEALKNRKIKGAGLDVLTDEPPRNSSPLIGLGNCVITPHAAWASYESRMRLMNTAVENVAGYISGNPVNVVS
jgi:glycerate dehydrogenase